MCVCVCVCVWGGGGGGGGGGAADILVLSTSFLHGRRLLRTFNAS